MKFNNKERRYFIRPDLSGHTYKLYDGFIMETRVVIKQYKKLINRIIDLKLSNPQTPLIKKEIQKLQQQL